MVAKTIYLGFTSTVLLLISLPGAQGLPKWLKPERVEDGSKFAPREYSVYESPPVTYGGYQYGGYGPQPTIKYSSTSSVSSTSENSGELASTSSVSAVRSSASDPSGSVIASETSTIILLTTGVTTETQVPSTGSSSTSNGLAASNSDTFTLPSTVGSYTTGTSTPGSILTSTTEVQTATTYSIPSSSPEGKLSDSSTILGSSGARSSTTSAQSESTTVSETASAIGKLTLLPGPSVSSGSGPITSSSAQSYRSITTPVPTTTVLNCNHNNCLRQFIRSSAQLARFCSTYTTTINTATTDLPTYVSMCHQNPVEISSACSCIMTGSLPSATPSTESTLTSSGYLLLTSSGYSSSTEVDVTTVVISTVTQSTVITLKSSIKGTGSAGIPQSSSFSVGYTNISMIFFSATSYPISSGRVSQPLGTVTSKSHKTFSYTNSSRYSPSSTISGGFLRSSASHSTPYRTTNISAISRPTGTRSLPLSTSSVGTISPYSSGLSTSPLYPLSNSSTGWFPTGTGSVTSSALGGITTSSGSTSVLYPLSNSSTTVGPTGSGSYSITSVSPLSTASSNSGGVTSCTQALSAPYAITNSTLCGAPTGTGGISNSSPVGPLSTGGVSSSSISGSILSSSQATNAPYPALNTTSGFEPTSVGSSYAPFSTGVSWSSISRSELPSNYSVGPLSSSYPSSTGSGPITTTALPSGPYPISNSTSSDGPTGTGSLPSSASTIQSSGYTISSIPTYGPSFTFSPTGTGSFPSSTGLNGGTLKSGPFPTVNSTSTAGPSSGSLISSGSYGLPTSPTSSLLTSTSTVGGVFTSPASFSIGPNSSGASSTVSGSGSSSSNSASSNASVSSLSTNYDPGQSSILTESGGATTSAPPLPTYFNPPPPPPGYYPRRLEKNQRND